MSTNNLIHKRLHPHPIDVPHNRFLGTTTGQAFSYIGEAIRNSAKHIVVKDHHGSKSTDRELQNKIQRLVAKNELVGFTYGRNDNGEFWIMCDILER